MEFKLTYRSLVFKYALLALAIVYLNVKFHPKSVPAWAGSWLWGLFAIVAYVVYDDIRDYYRFFTGKPILVINEEFIYDKVTDRKFYWNDIEEVTVYEGWRPSQFDIKLYHPEQYLSKLYKNRKSRKKDKNHVFRVWITDVNVKPGELKSILKKFSDAPEDRESAIAERQE